jgi:hypothetical protein
MLTIRDSRLVLRSTTAIRAFTPHSLFASGEQGFWFDPSPETCFTTPLGTTPASAGDTVGLMLDKSQQQTFETRRNLVTWSEEFDNAAWGKTNIAVTANITVAPDGTITADQITETSGGPFVRQISQSYSVTNSAMTFSVYVKASSGNRFVGILPVNSTLSGNNLAYVFDLDTATFLGVNTLAPAPVGTSTNQTIQAVGNGWYFLSVTVTNVNVGVTASCGVRLFNNFVENSVGSANSSYIGDGVSGIFVWGAQLEGGSAATAYQEVDSLPTTWFGNHAIQATLANRPILGRKPRGGSRNLLRQTAILGTQTRPVTAAQHTLSFRGTGTVTLSGASTAGPLVGTGADDVVSLTFTPTAGNLTLTVSGTVNDAQLELGSVRSTYQLVADASGFDITEAGKADCWYLYGGGVADPRWMQTPTITPNTDKTQVFAGVRKLSDANRASVVEMSTTIASNNGAFLMTAPDTSASYAFATKGDVNSTSDISGFTAPITNVVTGLGDISGDSAVLRLNGSQVAQNTSDQGAGNYLAYPAYIMSRAGTSLFFNGEIYALATRFGPNMNVRTIERFERWIANLVAEDTIP